MSAKACDIRLIYPCILNLKENKKSNFNNEKTPLIEKINPFVEKSSRLQSFKSTFTRLFGQSKN